MAVIDDLEKRLTVYQATELRLLTEGQSVKDEDDRERKEGSLKERALNRYRCKSNASKTLALD